MVLTPILQMPNYFIPNWSKQKGGPEIGETQTLSSQSVTRGRSHPSQNKLSNKFPRPCNNTSEGSLGPLQGSTNKK